MQTPDKAQTRARLEAMAAEAQSTTPLNISEEARELARLAHTPGPWHWDGRALVPTTRNPDTSAVHTILMQDGGCGYLASDWRKTHAELDADLALIAAAPDMLAVLIELRESARYWSEYDVPLGIVCRINDAINKATGVAAPAEAAKVAA